MRISLTGFNHINVLPKESVLLGIHLEKVTITTEDMETGERKNLVKNKLSIGILLAELVFFI